MKKIILLAMLALAETNISATAQDISVPNGSYTNSITVGPNEIVNGLDYLFAQINFTNPTTPSNIGTVSAAFGLNASYSNQFSPHYTFGELRTYTITPNDITVPISGFEIRGASGKTNETYPFDFFYTAIGLTDSQIREIRAGHWSLYVLGSGFPDGEIHAPILSPDSDGDGVRDIDDLCQETPSGAIVDAHGCSIDQLCPCEGTWRNHGEYLVAVGHATADFLRDGVITKAQRNEILKQAARSNCGKRLPAGFYGQSLVYYSNNTAGVPYQTYISVYDHNGKLVTRTASNHIGQFYAHVPWGDYMLVPTHPGQRLPPRKLSQYVPLANGADPTAAFINIMVFPNHNLIQLTPVAVEYQSTQSPP